MWRGGRGRREAGRGRWEKRKKSMLARSRARGKGREEGAENGGVGTERDFGSEGIKEMCANALA
jgi:hypothetical protein